LVNAFFIPKSIITNIDGFTTVQLKLFPLDNASFYICVIELFVL